jgi:hypothetical protein
MNLILLEKLIEFIIYIDDVLIYSKFMKEHIIHLEYVLKKLKENQFFVNRANNKFSQGNMNLLGHVLTRKGVRPNPKKVEAIECWQMLATCQFKTCKFLSKIHQGFFKIS